LINCDCHVGENSVIGSASLSAFRGVGAGHNPLLIKPFPSEDEEAALSHVAEVEAPLSHAQKQSADFAFKARGFVEYTNQRFLRNVAACDRWIFDVGANTGQFAQSPRACGYHGHIISFEPLSTPATLVRGCVGSAVGRCRALRIRR
jgi:hypothetical protein